MPHDDNGIIHKCIDIKILLSKISHDDNDSIKILIFSPLINDNVFNDIVSHIYRIYQNISWHNAEINKYSVDT